MQKIEQYLNLASRSYYAGEPFISDEVFDRLADSIGYNKVGATETGTKAKHYMRLYSLNKYYEDEGAQPLSEYHTNDKVNSIKLDGAAGSILYINGELAQVLTRGDGIEGQKITDKFLDSRLVPSKIDTPYRILQISGEFVSPKVIPNARNYAAGALNLGDIDEFKSRTLSFIAYGVYADPKPPDSYIESLKELESYGFQTVLDTELHNIYPSDGIVVRLVSNKEFEKLGYTAKFPRGAYAKKIRGDAVETTLLSVEWQVGKSGKVTPVAHLEPVMIEDAIVSRATLNNPGFIEMLGLCIGDRVGCIRAGSIIPTIVYKVDA